MQEVWKDIEGYEGYYQISNKGQVKSLDRFIKKSNGRINFIKGRILKQATLGHGYPNVNLFFHKVGRTHTIHRLAATYFIPNPNNLPVVNHINAIKTDYRIENLEWVTKQDDVIHAIKNGLTKGSKIDYTGCLVMIEAFNEGYLGKNIAQYFKVNRSYVSSVTTGRKKMILPEKVAAAYSGVLVE